MLRRFRRDRRGASEIVGTALFLVILFFFFSNVFLWHDQVTREMDQVVVDRMNSGIGVEPFDESGIRVGIFDGSPVVLRVDNFGGLDVTLSRLWISNSEQSVGWENDHVPVDFEPYNVHIMAGDQKDITLTFDGGMVSVSVDGHSVYAKYAPPPEGRVMFRVLTKRANSAACSLEL